MTVATDLTTALGTQRRLMLRIEGMAEELWQDDGTGTAPGYEKYASLGGWTQLSPAANPTVRRGHACCYDPIRDELVMFGGYAQSGTYNETWCYSFSSANWVQKSPVTSPPEIWRHSMVWDSANEVVLLFGGEDCPVGNKYNHLYSWDGTDWTEERADGAVGNPDKRSDAAMGLDSTNETVLMFGGLETGTAPQNELFELDLSDYSWTTVTTYSTPSVRYGGALVYDTANDTWLYCGGRDNSTTYTELYEFNRTSCFWKLISSAVPDVGVWDVGGAYDSAKSWVLLFGVSGTYSVASKMGIFNLSFTDYPEIDAPGAKPAQRWQHGGIHYRATDGYLYLFGGADISTNGGKNDLWKFQVPTSAARARTGYCCLLPPQEASQEIDLGEMTSGLSAMTFEILDIKDSDGDSRFGPVWGAPARWDSEDESQWRIAEGTERHQTIDANALNIPVQYAADSATAGTIYIHHERITYQSINGNEFVNCSRGTSPVSGSALGHTIYQPQDGDADFIAVVGTVPFTFAGARVGLFVLTRDPLTADWHTDGSEQLLWTGRLTHSIRYVPARAVWQLTGESIVQELDRNVCNSLTQLTCPITDQRDNSLINLSGTMGLKFTVEAFDTSNTLVGKQYCTLTAGYYNILNLPEMLNQAYLVSTNGSGTDLRPSIGLSFGYGYGKGWVYAYNKSGGDVKVTIKIYSGHLNGTDDFCHGLNALGFPGNGVFAFEFAASSGARGEGHYAPNPAMGWYHPTDSRCNNGQLVVPVAARRGDGDIFAQQTAAKGAYIRIENGTTLGRSKDLEFNYYANITSEAGGLWTLGTYSPPHQRQDHTSFVGVEAGGDETLTIDQVCMYGEGGDVKPFTAMLPFILSTGTPGLNGTYDTYPRGWGLAIPSTFVDTDSFVDADANLDADLADRVCYPIDEPTALSEIIAREAKLFQKTVVWRAGQIRVVDVSNLATDTWTVHISESNRYDRRDMPELSMELGTVVNQWKIQLYGPMTGEEEPLLTVTDADSVDNLGEAKVVEIDHPGIKVGAYGIPNRIRDNLIASRPTHLRRPLPMVEVSLMPTLARRVFVGDVVKFTSTCTPNFTGDGSNDTVCYALVTRVGWDYSIWKGTAQLMLLVGTENLATPWAPSAMVNMDYNSNGYSHPYLYLTSHYFGTSGTDWDDGSRFVAGHRVVVRETSPANANTIVEWGPLAVLTSYDNTSKCIEIDSALTGYNASLEYMVTAANWGDASVAQRLLGTWQANASTGQFTDGNVAKIWG